MATAVARKLDSITQSGGIRARDVAQLLKTTPQTVSRWRTGRSTPRPNSLDRLLRLEWLASQLAQVYAPATHESGYSVRIATWVARGRSTSSQATEWMRFSRSSIVCSRPLTPKSRRARDTTSATLRSLTPRRH